MTYDFEAQRRAWAHPPVDSRNAYVSSAELLKLGDDELRALAMAMFAARYGGWRNTGNLWLSNLGLATTHGRTVLDYGCGFGTEALTYAWAGNDVVVTDIAIDNIRLTLRVLHAFGLVEHGTHHIGPEPGIPMPDGSVDVFHCSGVLHHIPYPRDVMTEAWRLLAPGGEARLMLYSDEGWRQATGVEPPEEVTQHPLFSQFVRHFDGVGEYADWYNRERLEQRFGDLFVVEQCEHITPNGQYLTATLRRKD